MNHVTSPMSTGSGGEVRVRLGRGPQAAQGGAAGAGAEWVRPRPLKAAAAAA
jgi:hypothetical protein